MIARVGQFDCGHGSSGALMGMERWAKDGWVGTPPYFIAHTDALPHHHSTSASFLSVVSSASDVLACLLCFSLLALVRTCSIHGAVWASGSPCSHPMYVSPRTFRWPKPEWSGSRQSVDSGMDPVIVVLVEPICEDFWYFVDHWHRHRGRRRRGGRRI